MDYGELIRSARERASISQRELARRMFGDPDRSSGISRLENGEHRPSLETLERIANALDADLRVEFEFTE